MTSEATNLTAIQYAAVRPDRILGEGDNELGQYLTHGQDVDRRGAIQSALIDMACLANLLSAIPQEQVSELQPGTLSRVAWRIETLANRVLVLEGDAPGSWRG